MSVAKIDEPFEGAQADVDAEARDLDEREQKLWDLIHVELADLLTPDIPRTTIIRFIRGYATEEDPTAATLERLRAMLVWRKEKNVGTILQRELPNHEEFKKAWPSGIHGFGKMGRCVYVERLGLMEPEVVTSKFTEEQLIEFHVQMMERIDQVKQELSAKYGRTVYKHVVILDMNGFGYKHLGKKFSGPLQTLIHIDQHYYPECLYKMIIVNAPFVFKMAWAMAKPFIHPLTKARIKVGNSYLKEYIDESDIPSFLSGSCNCAEGRCLDVEFEKGGQME